MNMNNQEFDLEKEENSQVSSDSNMATQRTDSQEIINCTRCGKPMLKKSKYCMHCGEINMLSEKNETVNAYFSRGKKIQEKQELKQYNRKLPSIKKSDVDKNGVTRKEKLYTLRKNISSFIILIMLVIVAINYNVVLKYLDDFKRDHYLRQVGKIVDQVKEEYETKNCYNTSTTGLYYSFEDSQDYFKTFMSFYTFGYYSGYVEIIKNIDGSTDYIVNITDGKYGMENVKYTDHINRDVIKKVTSIKMPNGGLICE